ncbi:hypothetical protein KSC_059330 [Ktedonobacter sp. SOSP1-52]|uniref:hypothetical protein n=1 Tax=Ktedonobacter sp. SOSP1-52 TaxID=2778366 RepID=UPI001916667D|nr:hypothetical protein [Ktedonobacter sp. SOSP1-52]GHO67041.1 hypothetical protein KSC_059330 [Ktedonobacter sp. SOSP1-52]
MREELSRLRRSRVQGVVADDLAKPGHLPPHPVPEVSLRAEARAKEKLGIPANNGYTTCNSRQLDYNIGIFD